MTISHRMGEGAARAARFHRPSALAVVAVGALGALGLLALAPPTWVDTLAYHLTAPALFNGVHKWIDVAHCQFRYRLLAEAYFGQGLLVGGERAAGLLNTLVLVLLVWLAKAWGETLSGKQAGWLAAAALATSVQLGFLAMHMKDDLFAAAFALLALRGWCGAWTLRSPRWTFLTGCALGWAVCAKYTAAVPALGMGALLVLRAGRHGSRALTHFGLLAAGIAMAGGGPLVAGWLWTGNPVYPFLFGGLGWSAASATVLQQYGAPGFDWELTRPLTLVRTVARFVVEDAPLLLAAVPAIGLLPVALWPGLAAWGVGLIPLAVAARSVRFLFPLVPFFAVAAAVTVGNFLSIRRDAITRRVGEGLLILGLALGAARSILRADVVSGSWPAALGLEAPAVYRARVLTTWDGVTREVAGRASGTERLIVIGDIRGDGLTPYVLTRDLADAPVMLEAVHASFDAAGVAKRLRQWGAGWVLLNDISAEYLAHGLAPEFSWTPDELVRYRAYWERYAEPVPLMTPRDGLNGGFSLARLRRSPGPVATVMTHLPGTESLGAARVDEDPEQYAHRVVAAAHWLPRLAWLTMQAAPELIRRGRYAEAEALVRPCLAARWPQADVLHGQMGVALQNQRKYREALAEFREAERLNPAQGAYRTLREQVMRKLGKDGRADKGR